MPVTLPHTWNTLDGQEGGGDYWRCECVYEKTYKVKVLLPATPIWDRDRRAIS